MKSTIMKSACLGAALTFCTHLPAGEPPNDPSSAGVQAELLSADTLTKWVVEANPSVAALASAAEAARYRVAPAGALDDPVLSYGFAPRTVASDRLNQRVEFGQRIPWPGTLAAREAVARHQAAAADNDRAALELEIIAQARSAHAQWWFVRAALAIHHAAETLVGELIATASAGYAAGRSLKQDVLQAEVEQANLDQEELRLLRLRTTVQSRINALLNRSPDAPLPPASAPDPVREPPPFATLRMSALASHPQLARLDARLAANQSRVALAEKAFYPEFQVGIGYNSLWDDTDKRPIIGVTINVPLDRSRRRSELAAARADSSRSQWALVERRAELLDALAQARAAVVEARRSVQLYENDLVPLADEYLDTTIADYRSGAGAFAKVIDAEQRKLAADLALARARAAHAEHMAELLRTAGMPHPLPRAALTGAEQ